MFLILQFTTIFMIVSTGTCQIPKTKKIEEVVRLKNLGNESIAVGDNIELECQTTFYAKFISINWKTPEHEIYKNVSLKENTNSNYVTTSTLIIPKAGMQHGGLYICEIVYKQVNYTLAIRKITVIVYSESKVPWDEDRIDIISRPIPIKANAEFEMLIKTFPYVSITSFRKTRQFENTSNTTLSVKLTNDGIDRGVYIFKAKITFNYITPDDLGSYLIEFQNRVKSVSTTFEVKFFNSISMDLVGINEDDMIAVYQCSAIGEQKSNITWVFEKCDISEWFLQGYDNNSTCSEQLTLKELYHEDRGLQMISYISVNLTNTGILGCVSQGLQAVETIFYPQYEFDFFLTYENENFNKFVNKTESLGVVYGQSVVAVCLRSLYKYTSNILWYHNSENINTGHWLHPEDVYYPFKDKAANQLFISYPVKDQLGNLTCQVFTRTGDVESKTVEVVSESMWSLHKELSLEDLNGGHTTTGQDIKLKCDITFYRRVDITWLFLYDEDRDVSPDNKIASDLDSEVTYIEKKSQKTVETKTNSNVYITTSYLTIAQVNNSNTGYYFCRNSDDYGNFMWVKIYELNATILVFENEIDFDENNMIKVLMTAHPPPTVIWFDNHGKEIATEPPPHTSNFLLSLNQILDRREEDANYEAILKFKNIDTKDFGNYKIVVENEHGKIEDSVEVKVDAMPTIKLHIYNTTTENATFKCSSTAYPKPTIEWYFKKCTTLECCLDMDILNSKFENNRELWNESIGLHHISYITVSLSNRGVLLCRSANSLQEIFQYEPILGFGTDEFDVSIENPDNLKYLGKTFELVDTDEFTAICAASRSKYLNEFLWLYNGEDNVIEKNNPNKYYTNTTANTVVGKAVLDLPLRENFSKVTIDMEEFDEDSIQCNYSCSVLKRNNGIFKSQYFFVKKQSPSYLKISKTNMVNNSVQVAVTSTWAFYCYIEGFPTPTIKWYKNNQRILDSEKFKYTNDEQVLEIYYVDPDDEGTYECEVQNKYHTSVKYSSLNVVINNPWPYLQAILLSLALCFVAVLALIKLRTERKIKKKLNLLGLFYLEKDSWDKILSKQGTDNEAVLLPFDRKWEIPFENVKMGKRLGSGAFGITFQADVANFFPNNSIKTVALKTVNSSSGFESAKALVSELKILSHLGSHVNVVNFLGACTQHIVKVSSKDLLIWSFQIARGMEYLGSRRVVHGDLAARNVLLTDENVVKVCDFGLAKNIYNYEEYVKKSEGPLPLKWMALETIEKGIFSTQSDVWSFGVVLWEFFSLGKIPYPGEIINQDFCNKLLNGYRMESPAAATTKIYNIMLSCWQLDPAQRPSFPDLAEQVGSLLEEPIKDHYIEMNNPYTLMNKQQFEGGFDYLTMVNPINYQSMGYSNSSECRLEAESIL